MLKSTQSLVAYAPGLLAIILIKVLAPGYYAQQNTRTPVKIGILAMVTNMVLNLILVFPLAHAGLALATSLSSGLNAYLLYRGLVRSGIYRPQRGWLWIWARVGFAAAAMGIMLYLGCGELESWFALRSSVRVWHLSLWILAAAGLYFLLLYLTGIRLRHFKSLHP